jgi:hypothetical protein
VIELTAADAGEKLVERQDWKPIRPPRPHFRKLPLEEQVKLVRLTRATGG